MTARVKKGEKNTKTQRGVSGSDEPNNPTLCVIFYDRLSFLPGPWVCVTKGSVAYDGGFTETNKATLCLQRFFFCKTHVCCESLSFPVWLSFRSATITPSSCRKRKRRMRHLLQVQKLKEIYPKENV